MKTILCVCLLLLGRHAFGQSDTTRMEPLDSLPVRVDFPYGLISELGYAQTTYYMPNLKSFLKANQMGGANTSGFQLHLGLGFRYKRVKIITQTNVPLTAWRQKGGPGTWVVRQRGGYQYGLVVGYDLLNGYTRRLYLYSGLGIMAVNLDVYRKSGQTVTFGSLPQNSGIGGASLLRIAQAPYVDMGVEYSFREKRVQSISYTARIGYRLGIRQKTWGNEVYSFSDPISDKVSQYYVSFFNSFSSNAKRQPKK